MGKIHNDMKLKLFEGVIDNADGKNFNNAPNESLSLHFKGETHARQTDIERKLEDAPWKDVSIFEYMKDLRIT